MDPSVGVRRDPPMPQAFYAVGLARCDDTVVASQDCLFRTPFAPDLARLLEQITLPDFAGSDYRHVEQTP
jgi:hypothetical protein